MQAIVRACQAQGWPAETVAVISNRPDAEGLAFARTQNIATACVDHRTYATRESFDQALLQEVNRYKPDLVILAGFMRILSPNFVNAYTGRLINIHPSLLPSFPGLHTHERAIEAGVKWHGATVHFVTEELDYGPIIIQAAVPVHSQDTPSILAQRVLRYEHMIYPRAVQWFVQDQLQHSEGRISLVLPVGQEGAQWVFGAEDNDKNSRE